MIPRTHQEIYKVKSRTPQRTYSTTPQNLPLARTSGLVPYRNGCGFVLSTGVPPQLERLIKGKPNIIVTGIVLDETPEAPFREDLLLQQAAPRGERCGQQPSLCPRPLPTYSRRGTGTPFDQPLSASQKTSPTSDIPPKSSNGGKRVSVPTSVDSSRTGSFGGGSGYGNLGDLDLMAAVRESL